MELVPSGRKESVSHHDTKTTIRDILRNAGYNAFVEHTVRFVYHGALDRSRQVDVAIPSARIAVEVWTRAAARKSRRIVTRRRELAEQGWTLIDVVVGQWDADQLIAEVSSIINRQSEIDHHLTLLLKQASALEQAAWQMEHRAAELRATASNLTETAKAAFHAAMAQQAITQFERSVEVAS
jgi:hypothetical protein